MKGPAQALPSSPQHTAQYMRGERNSLFAGWRPAVQRNYQDVSNGWSMAAARAKDIIQNSGMITGMISQSKSDIVGKGLQLRLKPNVEYFGGSEDAAQKWAADVERKFRMWGARPQECDAEDRSTFGKFQSKQFGAFIAFGETFTAVPARRTTQRTKYRTKFKAVPAYLVSTHRNGTDVIHGVKVDQFGAAQGYWFRETKMGQLVVGQDVYVPRRDYLGRPNVIHVMDGEIDEVRGISKLAPVLQVVKQFDQLQTATLQAALLQTVFAATIESNLPSVEILNALRNPGDPAQASGLENFMDASAGWNKNVNIDLDQPGRIAHLFSGEELKFNKNQHPNEFYDKFISWLLREIARCLDLTYESATGDFSSATYASLNIGETKNYQTVLARRNNIIAPMNDEIFDCWLEEAIMLGTVKFPGDLEGFYNNRADAFETSWRGPGKPQADDLKAAKGYESLLNNRIASATEIAEERGRDIDDIYAEIEREQAERQRRGIKDAVADRTPTVEDQVMINESAPAPAPRP